MTYEEYLAEELANRKRPHKYSAIATVVDGIRFASKAEARRYQELKILERGGVITNLELQPKFPLVVEGVKVATYIADFAYTDKHGSKVVEDVKGMETDVFKIKRKLFEVLYKIPLTIVK